MKISARYIFFTRRNGKKFTILVDEADFGFLSQRHWNVDAKGYARCYAAGRYVKMHRLLLDPPPDLVVDHINGNTVDNRRQNLRACTCAENLRNAAPRVGSSRFKGVSRKKRRRQWYARIREGGKVRHLGAFELEADAARAYDKAAIERFGEFARLNFPLGEAKR